MKVRKFVVEVAKGEWGVHTDWIEKEFDDLGEANKFALAYLWVGHAVRMYDMERFEEETE